MTALVLALVVIGTLATGSTVLWGALVTCFCAAAAWEFARLSPTASRSQIIAFAVAMLVGDDHSEIAKTLFKSFLPFLLLAAVFWLAVVPFQLSRR